ncbi:MAG TPA: PAS domain S-box protein [Gemmatimonadales bacterium]|jgi:PAS domain S-box-containing protein|nr:PAS domain S-box protein [Gemmatimonadales bacterium]
MSEPLQDDSAAAEAVRVAALRRYGITDTEPEPIFDGIARIAARICNTPIAMVTFIDESHQSIKARVGIELNSTARTDSFCTNILNQATPLVIEDATADARVRGISMVREAPFVRFYAGAPIRTDDGYGLGAVCVLDTRPRKLEAFQLAALEALADDVSARLESRRSAAALAESERLHRGLFTASPLVMWLFDAETGRFLDVNDAAVATYGWSREEFLAGQVADLWLPEDAAEKASRFVAGLPARTEPTITRHRRKDGSVLVINAAAHEVTVRGRRAMLGVVSDVTERESAAVALREANEKFAAAQRLAEIGSWDADFATGRFGGSDELHRILGINPGTLTDIAGFRALIHPDDRARVQAARVLAQAPGAMLDVEHRVVRPDGDVRWVNTQGRMQQDAGGARMVGTVQNITEWRESELRLREQVALIDAARDAIMVRRLDDTIVSWNGGAERIFGWTAAEAVGRNALELLHRDAEAFATANARLLETGHWSGELRKATKGGDEVIVDGSWTLLRHDDGTPKGVLVINTDVTDKRKLEAQFLRAQRMESIGTLAGGIAHDLNNMLAPILMSIELLRMSVTDQGAAELLATIEASARRGADLVKQVLTFARGVEGQREEMTVKHVLDEVAKLAHDTFPRAIDVVSSVAPDLWWVTGDRTQLHQVLLNLVVNARDAMPGGGRLELSAANVTLDAQYAAMTPEAKASGYVLLQVADTGSGIPEGIRERIFDPFFTTKGVGEGTGLGLATVQAIVRSHGGFVTVYSEVGNGTTFKVYLPALDGRGTAAEDALPEALPRGKGETILVIDDEPAIRDISRQTLEAFGYAVITATDGADGLTKYVQEGGAIDAVITDIMMPIMDGPAFIQAVRRLNPEVRIIAASGLTVGASHSAPILGIRHFLPKPYTADTMLRALREVLTDR